MTPLLRALLLPLLCLPLLAACGGDDDDDAAADPTATTAEQDNGQPTEAESDSDDGGDNDDTGDTGGSGASGDRTVQVEVDGQTFSAIAGLCEISDDEIRVAGFLSQDGSDVRISVRRGGGLLGAIGVIIDDESTYIGSDDDAEITIDGNTLTWVGEFSRPTDAGPESVGEGRLIATCAGG